MTHKVPKHPVTVVPPTDLEQIDAKLANLVGARTAARIQGKTDDATALSDHINDLLEDRLDHMNSEAA